MGSRRSRRGRPTARGDKGWANAAAPSSQRVCDAGVDDPPARVRGPTSTMTTRPTRSWSTSPRIFARRWRRTPRLDLLAKIRGEVDQLFVGRVVIVDVLRRLE